MSDGLDIAAEAVDRAQFETRKYVGEIDGYAVILTAKVNSHDSAIVTVTAGENLIDEFDDFVHVTGENVSIREDFDHIREARNRAKELAEKHGIEPWEEDE